MHPMKHPIRVIAMNAFLNDLNRVLKQERDDLAADESIPSEQKALTLAALERQAKEEGNRVAAAICEKDVESMRGCKLWWPTIRAKKAIDEVKEEEARREERAARKRWREEHPEEVAEEVRAARRRRYEQHREETIAQVTKYRAELTADSIEGKACFYGRKCLEDPTNALVGKVKMLHFVCRKHVGRYEADALRRTKSTIRRAQAADDFDGPALLQQMLDAAWEIFEFISAPSRAGLADALATEERVVWYDTGASHCAAMSPEEAKSSTQKWTGDFLVRVGAVDSQGTVVRAVRRCTDLCKAPGAMARAHCKWEVFEGRSNSYALLQQTRTCSEAEMRDYLATFLAGSLCVGYGGGIDESRLSGFIGSRSNISYFDLGVKYMYTTSRSVIAGHGARALTGQGGIVPTPSSRIGFLMKHMFADGDEMLCITGGGPDLDELDTRCLDSDELLDAFRATISVQRSFDVSISNLDVLYQAVSTLHPALMDIVENILSQENMSKNPKARIYVYWLVSGFDEI
ncbi:hypothetical protein EC968_006796 [Mortierella alpina]|nr:hypothetical protein EC968_006796 [Mortierella alpina]